MAYLGYFKIWINEPPAVHINETVKSVWDFFIGQMSEGYHWGYSLFGLNSDAPSIADEKYGLISPDSLLMLNSFFYTHLPQILLWILVFELSWYFQHRGMHDNKFLWKFGHEYHHQWRRPEHMMGQV
jgi:sterol desaturase/sphingolipid hydroxylase (fatty acid hydroxylase superfamily)